jgi:FixJ family two-component response regulator
MDLVVNGLPNKAVAARLQVSPKTVEAHRANAMRKMEASSLPELVRFAEMITEPSATASPHRMRDIGE